MRFLDLFRHMVGLLGRVISPSQGLYLHRTTQHRKTRKNIHAMSGIRTHDPGQDPRLRPHGHCDRQKHNIGYLNAFILAKMSVPQIVKCVSYLTHSYDKTARNGSDLALSLWRYTCCGLTKWGLDKIWGSHDDKYEEDDSLLGCCAV
jgi:hypothetical protein